jgi:hypothetical protein
MEAWLDNNNRYLEASLQWLRLRLQKFVPPETQLTSNPPQPSLPVNAASNSSWKGFSRWMGASAIPVKGVRLLPEGNPPSLDKQIADAAAKRETAAKMDPPPALLLLANRFGLSSFERDTLLLCAALEFDPSLASLCGLAQGGQSRSYPTFSLALSVLDEPRWDVLSAHRPLRYARLIDINQPASVPLTASPLRADERIVNYLKGLNVVDDRLVTILQPLGTGAAPLAASQQLLVEEILARFRQSALQSTIPVVQLVGADASSRIAVARQVCAEVNRELHRLAMETLPVQSAEIEILARLWQRESLLRPVALYVEMQNTEGVSAEGSAPLYRFLSREMGLVFLGNNEAPVRINTPSFSIKVNKPTAAEQCEAWTTLLKGTEPETETVTTAQMLAGEFNFSLSDIHEAAATASKPSTEPVDMRRRVWHECRNLTRPRLDSLAQRLEPKATWDDLVLPDEQMALMRQIAGQVRERHKVYEQWGFSQMMNRGFGISALFAGESGTGKTMAAEVIANDLQLNLYRIDLSAVVSKYIGETEKNLRKLFDAAERGGAILFFDEADALFGKRSEVKDSHDRYANIEINYLLQRVEAFSGLAILATNMKSALDGAFMRRLRFIVNLPFPGIKERKRIWEKALPGLTPQKDLDYQRLARLNISGGNIHSIALNAAFLAAQNGQTVTMPTLLTAARAELRKLEKGYSEAELR